MKLDQVAYFCRDEDDDNRLKSMLGLADKPWIVDRVTTRGFVRGYEGEQVSISYLQFCDALGMQFEIIRPIRGAHWLFMENEIGRMQSPYVAHVGFHLDEGEDFPKMEHATLIQDVRSISHTCEYLTTGAAAGRRYHYQIWRVSPHNYMKFIRRIHPK